MISRAYLLCYTPCDLRHESFNVGLLVCPQEGPRLWACTEDRARLLAFHALMDPHYDRYDPLPELGRYRLDVAARPERYSWEAMAQRHPYGADGHGRGLMETWDWAYAGCSTSEPAAYMAYLYGLLVAWPPMQSTMGGTGGERHDTAG